MTFNETFFVALGLTIVVDPITAAAMTGLLLALMAAAKQQKP